MAIISLDVSKNREIVNRLAGGEFLQSTDWVDLLRRENEEVEIFGLEEEGGIKASALVIKKKLLSSWFYYYIPRGPIGDKTAIKKLLTELKKLKSEAIFFRVEPVEDIFHDNEILGLVFKIHKTVNLQPQKTLLLDLSMNSEELLSAMHPKTRYNIRLAEKRGVKVFLSGKEDFDHFWSLMEKTGARDGFRLHSKDHYENLLSAEENVKLFLAEHKGRVIAGGIFSFFGNRVTYLHGASDNSDRNLMAPYLLQWTVILEAQKINQMKTPEAVYKYYDFYGIDEHKWPGVTRFKCGFGGLIKEYPGTYDLVCRPFWYNLYGYLRRLRRLF